MVKIISICVVAFLLLVGCASTPKSAQEDMMSKWISVEYFEDDEISMSTTLSLNSLVGDGAIIELLQPIGVDKKMIVRFIDDLDSLPNNKTITEIENKKVNVYAAGVSLNAVLFDIALENKINIVFADDAQDGVYLQPVTLQLYDVSVEDAIRVLTQSTGLAYRRVGEIFYIGPIEKLY